MGTEYFGYQSYKGSVKGVWLLFTNVSSIHFWSIGYAAPVLNKFVGMFALYKLTFVIVRRHCFYQWSFVKFCSGTCMFTYNNLISRQTLQNQQYLGDVSTAIPQYEEIDYGNSPLPTGVTCAHLDTFTTLYKEHSETILEAVFNLQV